MDEIEVFGVFCQEIRGVDSCITAAHDGDGLTLVDMTIAELAVMDALAGVFSFFRERQETAVHARCDDDGVGFIDMFRRFYAFWCRRESNRFDSVEFVDDGTEVFCLFLHMGD